MPMGCVSFCMFTSLVHWHYLCTACNIGSISSSKHTSSRLISFLLAGIIDWTKKSLTVVSEVWSCFTAAQRILPENKSSHLCHHVPWLSIHADRSIGLDVLLTFWQLHAKKLKGDRKIENLCGILLSGHIKGTAEFKIYIVNNWNVNNWILEKES